MAGGGIYQFSKDTLEKILDWNPKIIAEQLGVSLSAVYNYRMKIKKDGGVDAVLAKQSTIKKFVPKKFSVSSTPDKKETVIERVVEYKEELEFLKELNILDNLVPIIKENLPDMVVNSYLNMLCKELHDGKMFNKPDFFIDIEYKITSIMKDILKTKTIPEKIVEVEKKVEVEKLRIVEKKVGSPSSKDRPLDSVYTPERMIREYPQFFVNPLQVNNFIYLHLDKLIGHSLIVGNQYVVDEYGAILLLELADKTEEAYPIPSIKEEDKKNENEEVVFKPTIEVIEEVQVPTVRDSEINESLLDRSAKPTKEPRQIKGYYKANRDYLNSLDAFRYESDSNPHKTSAGEIAFSNYCDDELATNKHIYLVREDSVSKYLFIKKSDFNDIMSNFYKENRLGPVKLTKIVEAWRTKNLIEKSNTIKGSYQIDYNKLKQIICEKGGVLNSISFLK